MEENLVITPETQLVRNNAIFGSAIDDDLVMMDDTAGKYFGLNPVARKIWELLETPLSYDQLLTSLTTAYDVDYDQCQKDVRPFITDLLKNKLLHLA